MRNLGNPLSYSLKINLNSCFFAVLQAQLRISSQAAKEAMELLRFEPENSAEGYLSERISMELERIESDLKKYGR